MTLAGAIRSSNSIEGYRVSAEDALAAVDLGQPVETAEDDVAWDATLGGYRRAMTYVLQLHDDPNVTCNTGLFNGLHVMLVDYDLDALPGRWRPGTVFVNDTATGTSSTRALTPTRSPSSWRSSPCPSRTMTSPRWCARPRGCFCLTAHHRQANVLLARVREAGRIHEMIDEQLARHDFADRMPDPLHLAVAGHRLTNETYRVQADTSPNTASRDLRALVDAGLLTAHDPYAQPRLL